MGIVRYLRDLPPAHYLLKINSFTKLQQTHLEMFQSQEFESGGYKWCLFLYPNGSSAAQAGNYISLYLGIADTDSLPPNWRVNVYSKFFIYDLKQNKYLTVEDDATSGKPSVYDRMNKRVGYHQLISQADFKNPANGHLVNDACVFGVEVFVDQYTGKGESFTINTVDTQHNSYTWQIPNFSARDDTRLWSQAFTIGGREWKLNIDPMGYKAGKDKTLCVSLCLADSSTLPSGRKLYAEYELTVKNQLDINDEIKKGANWFCASNYTFGWINFMPLVAVNNIAKGFLVRDTITVEVKILVASVAQDF